MTEIKEESTLDPSETHWAENKWISWASTNETPTTWTEPNQKETKKIHSKSHAFYVYKYIYLYVFHSVWFVPCYQRENEESHKNRKNIDITGIVLFVFRISADLKLQ